MPLDYDISDELTDVLLKLRKRDPKRLEIIYKKMKQIIADEDAIEHYKNLRHDLRELKRVHINGSFVLTFKYFKDKKAVLFLDFEHHDRAYKR